MTEYQRERVRIARSFVQDYKQSTPCADCGVVDSDWHMYLTLREDSKYRKPINRLVSGGAATARLLEVLEDRDLVCIRCYGVRQSRSMSKRWSTWRANELPKAKAAISFAKQSMPNAPRRDKNLYNQPGARELYADRGMAIEPNGSVVDAETGQPLNEDERARRILAGNNWRSAPAMSVAVVPFTAQPDLLGERLAEFAAQIREE